MDLAIEASVGENWVLLGQGLFFLALAFYYLRKPPQKINNLYGYRTRRSMSNEDIWKFANAQSGKDFFKVAFLTFVVGIALMFFSFELRILIQLAVLLIGLGWAVWNTETVLNKEFDKNGNRK